MIEEQRLLPQWYWPSPSHVCITAACRRAGVEPRYTSLCWT